MARITQEQFYCNLIVAEKGLDQKIEAARLGLVALVNRRNALTKNRVDLNRIAMGGFRTIFFEEEGGMRYEVVTRDCGFPVPDSATE